MNYVRRLSFRRVEKSDSQSKLPLSWKLLRLLGAGTTRMCTSWLLTIPFHIAVSLCNKEVTAELDLGSGDCFLQMISYG